MNEAKVSDGENILFFSHDITIIMKNDFIIEKGSWEQTKKQDNGREKHSPVNVADGWISLWEQVCSCLNERSVVYLVCWIFRISNVGSAFSSLLDSFSFAQCLQESTHTFDHSFDLVPIYEIKSDHF